MDEFRPIPQHQAGLHDAVTLDPVLVDASGIPAPKVSYRISDNSRKMLAHAQQRGEEVLRAAASRAYGSPSGTSCRLPPKTISASDSCPGSRSCTRDAAFMK